MRRSFRVLARPACPHGCVSLGKSPSGSAPPVNPGRSSSPRGPGSPEAAHPQKSGHEGCSLHSRGLRRVTVTVQTRTVALSRSFTKFTLTSGPGSLESDQHSSQGLRPTTSGASERTQRSRRCILLCDGPQGTVGASAERARGPQRRGVQFLLPTPTQWLLGWPRGACAHQGPSQGPRDLEGWVWWTQGRTRAGADGERGEDSRWRRRSQVQRQEAGHEQAAPRFHTEMRALADVTDTWSRKKPRPRTHRQEALPHQPSKTRTGSGCAWPS